MKLTSKIILISLFLCFLIPAKSFSHKNDPRHKAMVTLAKNMKEISRISRSGEDFDQNTIDKVAEVYDLSKKFNIFFSKDDSKEKDSRASPKIWTEKDKFISFSNNFRISVENLLTHSQSGNKDQISKAISKVGANCGSCHRSFRLNKN